MYSDDCVAYWQGIEDDRLMKEKEIARISMGELLITVPENIKTVFCQALLQMHKSLDNIQYLINGYYPLSIDDENLRTSLIVNCLNGKDEIEYVIFGTNLFVKLPKNQLKIDVVNYLWGLMGTSSIVHITYEMLDYINEFLDFEFITEDDKKVLKGLLDRTPVPKIKES